jgi:hypothetical protein
MKLTSGLVALYVIAGVGLCADKPVAKKVTYQENVQPILRDKCFSCHDSDKVKGGLDVTTYTKLMEGGASGVVVKPGDAENSRFYALIVHKLKPVMPPNSDKLPDTVTNVIKEWIEQGALENAGSKVIAMKPKADIGLASISRGRPEGPPPMPETRLPLEPIVRYLRPNAVTAMACSPWAPLVAIGAPKQVFLYNTDTLDLIGILPFPQGQPNVLKFSRNGSLLLAGGGRSGHSGKAVVWSVKTGEKIIEVGDETETVLAADISPDQTLIALGGPNRMVRYYSTKDGEKIREVKKHTDWITSLEFSPDGVLLATGDRNGGLFVWEAFTGREYFNLRGHSAAVLDVSWRADSNALASGSEDGSVRLWEMENGGQIRSWGAGGGVQSVRFSQDGRLVTSARDRLARIWDQNGAQQRVFPAFNDVAMRGMLTHDGSRVIAGDWSGQVTVFISASGQPAGQLPTNPPPLAEQFEIAMKDLAAKQTAFEQSQAAAAAATAAAAAKQVELAATQKAAADAATAVKAAETAMPQMKAAMDASVAAIPGAQAKVAAKEIAAKALADACAKVKEAADKAKTDPMLAAEVVKCQQIVAAANSELEAARKALTDATNLSNAAKAKYAETEKNLPVMRNTALAAAKAVEAKNAEVAAVNAKVPPAQAGVGAAQQALLVASKTALDKWKALPPKK